MIKPEKIEPKAVALIAPHPVLLQAFKIKALFLNAVAKRQLQHGNYIPPVTISKS